MSILHLFWVMQEGQIFALHMVQLDSTGSFYIVLMQSLAKLDTQYFLYYPLDYCVNKHNSQGMYHIHIQYNLFTVYIPRLIKIFNIILKYDIICNSNEIYYLHILLKSLITVIDKAKMFLKIFNFKIIMKNIY